MTLGQWHLDCTPHSVWSGWLDTGSTSLFFKVLVSKMRNSVPVLNVAKRFSRIRYLEVFSKMLVLMIVAGSSLCSSLNVLFLPRQSFRSWSEVRALYVPYLYPALDYIKRLSSHSSDDRIGRCVGVIWSHTPMILSQLSNEIRNLSLFSCTTFEPSLSSSSSSWLLSHSREANSNF